MINARAETLLEKPSFKELVSTQRCLVPADGSMNGQRRQPQGADVERPFGGRRMELDLVLQPPPSQRMAAHEVSTLVNSPENDSAECIQRVSRIEPVNPQLPLL
jgi:putative SOS response-associated peptidase YedK